MEALLVGSRVVKLDFAGTLSFYPEARTELLEAADLGDVRHTYLSIPAQTHRVWSFSARTHNLQVAKRCKQASFLPPVRAAAFTPRQRSLACRYFRAAVGLASVNCNTRLDHRSTRSGVVSTSQLCGVCSACKQQVAGTGTAAEAAARRAQLR